MSRPLLVLVLGVTPLMAGCLGSGTSSSTAGSRPTARATPTLEIVIGRVASHGRSRPVRRLTLGCQPPTGTTPQPAEACAALRDYLRHPHRRSMNCLCPVVVPGAPYAAIDGTLDGKRLHARLTTCMCGVSIAAIRDLRVVTGLASR